MTRLFLFLLSFFLLVELTAQVSLQVSVLDVQSLKPIAQVEVLLGNTALGYVQTQVTDDLGMARFGGLEVHNGYQLVVAESPGRLGTRVDVGEMRVNRDASVTVLLASRKSFEADEVLISAGAVTAINTQDGEVAATLRREEIVQLPVEGRDITRILFRLPNVTQATGFYPEAPNVSINGANSLYTNYLIDGMDNNERFLGGQRFAIPVGFTQNVTVLSNNFSAEFGNTANGVINITSRSGSNEFSGEAFFITRPGQPLDARSPFATRDLSGNTVQDGFRRFQGGFAVGGPLVKNQTFYYLNFEHTTDQKDNLLNSPALGVNETVRGHNYFNYLSAKLDHHWKGRWRSSLRFNLGRVAIERQGGGLEGGVSFPSAGNRQNRNSLVLANRNVYTGDRLVAETNVQYAQFRWNYANPNNPDDPQVTVLDTLDNPVGILGHPGFVFDQTERTLQLQQKFSLLLDRHTLKFGAEYISSWHQLAGGGNPNGNYLVKLTAEQLNQVAGLGLGADLNVEDIPGNAQVERYDVELRPATFGARQGILSLYLEDQWTVSRRFTLNLGLRYDYDNLSRGGSRQGDVDNIAPRVSANFKLSPRSSLRAAYGMFYEKVLYAIYSDALQQNTTSADYRRQLQFLIDTGILPSDTDLEAITFDGNLTASVNNVNYLQGPPGESLQNNREQVFSDERRILNPHGYQNPYAHQFSLGYQQQLGRDFLFFFDLMHNQSYNLFRLRDLNTAEPYPLEDPAQVTVRTIDQADQTRPLPIVNTPGGSFAVLQGDTLRGIARKVIVTESVGRSRYYAATFNLQKDRGEDRYAFRLIYTLSLLENNTEDINFRAMDANDFEAEWGPSINDRRHVINGFFYWYPWRGLSVNLAALIQSGQPINYIPDAGIWGTTDLNGDGRSFGDAYVGNSDRWPGADRNQGRLPWAYTLDLGLQYDFRLGGTQRLRLRGDVFNLLNTTNLTGYSNNATQSNQIQVGPPGSPIVQRNAAPPRQFQFGVFYLF